MIRDTFESNPGLCQLFKRRILDKAQSAGLSGDLIDFESQLDMKGSYQENLRRFYRMYPQLAEESDFLRLKSLRPLSGAVLEQTWRSYECDNVNESTKPAESKVRQIIPELTVTYTIRHETQAERKNLQSGLEAISTDAMPAIDSNSAALTHSEFMRLLLDRITATAGEKFTKTILHQLGGEIGRAAFHHTTRVEGPHDNLVDSLDHALRMRGLGQVEAFEVLDHGSKVTYRCAIRDCSVCHKHVALSSTCDVMRGVVSRWLESFFQKKAEHTEVTCSAAGSRLCVIHVTFRKVG